MENVDMDAQEASNHEYLKKHIMYAKQFNPKFSEIANSMLSEYYVSIGKNFGSRRIRETIFKLAKEIARLKFKEEVDVEDAKETMQFYNVQLQQYQQEVSLSQDPRDKTYNACLEILMDFYSPFEFEELINTACSRNEQVSRYVGLKYKLEKNKKLRPILDMLLNHDHVMVIKKKPWVLQYRSRAHHVDAGTTDPTDSTDPTDPPKTLQNGQNHEETERENGSKKAKSASSEKSDRSDRSDRSDSSPSSYFKFKCYHDGCICKHSCDFQTDSKEEYERHGALKHPKNPLLYPSSAEIEKYHLTQQSQSWENH
jgi:hypothetical protein